jgi:hypothetical protein
LNRAVGRDPNGNQRGPQQGQRGPGQQGQRGNQPGQQPGDQQGQQGQQGQGQQGQGQQGQQGQQAGMQGQGGQQGQQGQRGGNLGGSSTGERGYDNLGMYRKPTNFTIPPTINDRAAGERAVLDAMRELSRMRANLQDSPETAKDVQDIMRELSRLNPSGNPLILEHIRGELIPQIEQLETQLRRKLDDSEGGQVRSAATEPVAPAYQDAVAEYFRRLSKGK